MTGMDVPRRQRPLAGVDQALGEGSARQPAELLDQLRERLARLDSNHPSASRRPADHGDAGVEAEAGDEVSAAAETSAVDEAKAGGAIKADGEVKTDGQVKTDGEADSAMARADRPESRRDADRTGGDDPGEATDPGPSAGEPSRAWSDGSSAGADRPGHGPSDAGPARPRRAGSADPYRPWFATDESVAPWFAE
jgi:hypothetical protein